MHCGNHDSFEYDFLSILKEKDLPGLDTILLIELGDSLYNIFVQQFILADSIGISAWYSQFAGTNPPNDLLDELNNIADFFDNNYSSRYYASLVDSLVNDYVIDNRFDKGEKCLLSSYALTTSTWWELSNCNNFQIRNGDDGMLCNFTEECEAANIVEGGAIGAVIGFLIEFVQPWVWVGSGDGQLTATFALAGAYLGGYLDINNCYECDDCHHPEIIRYQVDYTNCRIYSAKFYGSFEFAEDWEWDVQAHSGNFEGHNTLESRAYFPGTFDPGGYPWVITARTVCDGGVYPDQDNVGFSQTFSGNLPPTPIAIRGNVIANREDDFKYVTSTSFNGNLNNPSWGVSEGVQIINFGESNGTYYITVNFSEVNTSRGEIYLTLYDDCHQSYIERTKSIRLDHE